MPCIYRDMCVLIYQAMYIKGDSRERTCLRELNVISTCIPRRKIRKITPLMQLYVIDINLLYMGLPRMHSTGTV